ncbi:MAG TPA: helix-turn-helix domain-containing protein [Gemmatimonadales bacterium]|nr:helix-turn-helix domain-containing protein [Gemmatimonadales bacterium]
MPGPLQTLEYESSPGRWRFSSAPPEGALAGIVQEYWEVEGRLSPFRERILPNGSTEVMVNLGPPHQMVTHTGTSVWERAWFFGLHDRAIVIESLHGTHLVSARLHPLGALRLLGPDTAMRVNAVTDLETLLGLPARELRTQLLGAGSAGERFDLLERFLLPRLSAGAAPSPIVGEAARLIEEAHGHLRIASLHADLGVSRKQLWLRFARDLGMSPKAYARLQRFVWTLARLRESTSVEWPRLAAAAGYSDQSHLVRDFRRFASASPTEFLRTRTPDSTALLDEAG